MKTVKALREIYYNNKTRNAGDVFEMSDDHAAIFCGVAWAQLEPIPAQPKASPDNPPAQPVTPPNSLSASGKATGDGVPVSAPSTAEVLTQVKRRYKRRDMRAED
jgi:hypothetical protein